MNRIAFAALAAAAAFPAFAADRTEAVPTDPRLRVAKHSNDEVYEARLGVGQVFRLVLAPGERVVPDGMVWSDQATMDPEEEDQVPASRRFNQEAQAPQQAVPATTSSAPLSSCDRNMCRTVSGNTVYVRPAVPLRAQPFFLRTEWCLGERHRACLFRNYAFQITAVEAETFQVASAKADLTPKAAMYSLRFTYGDDEAELRRRVAAMEAKERRRGQGEWALNNPPPAPAPPTVPTPADLWDFGYCASAPRLHPDATWRSGRHTLMRFRGPRRVPQAYEMRADGSKALLASTLEPEPSHTTVRINGLPTAILLQEGKDTTCALYVGPDPDGRLEMAMPPQPVAALARRRR